MKIGYIGLGALGSRLARRFLGIHELIVWDASVAASAALGADGARVVASAAELASVSDVIMLCLPRSADVHQVIFGDRGLAAGLSAGKLIIDQTSGVPKETLQMAQALERSGVLLIDAAVSASPHIVGEGGATLMVGGADDVFERVLPILHVITRTVYHCGTRVGDGQAMKMVNNAMNAGIRVGTLEVTAMGRAAGLPLERLVDALNKGAGRNQITVKMLPAIAAGQASTNFSLALQIKDVNQAVALGMDVGVSMPLTNIVRGLLQIGLNTIGEKAQLEDMVKVVESMAATRFRDDESALVEGRNKSHGHVGTESPADDKRLVRLVDNAIAALCRLITYECVALGAKYGLSLSAMAEVLVRTSGWSDASQRMLPVLGTDAPSADVPLHRVLQDLKSAAQVGMNCGVPMMLATAARNIFEVAENRLDTDAPIDAMAQIYEAMAGVNFKRGDAVRV